MRLKVCRMYVKLWKSIFDWATVWLAALTFVALAGALITGNILNERQGKQLQQFTIDLEKQKGETAKAQAEVLRLQEQRLPRSLKFESNESLQALIASLKHRPFTAEILYKKGDGEAMWFAEQVRGLLLSAGWKVPHPAPIPEDMSANAVEKMHAEPDGVTLITKKSSDKDKPGDPEPIIANLLGAARSWDASFPDDFLRIIILQKP